MKILAAVVVVLGLLLPAPVFSGISCGSAGCVTYPDSIGSGGVTYASWNNGVVFQTDSLTTTTVWTTAIAALFATDSRTVVVGQWVMISFKGNVTHGATAGFQEMACYRSAGTATFAVQSSAGPAFATTSPGSPIYRVNATSGQIYNITGVYWLYTTGAGTATISCTGTTGGSNAAASVSNMKVEWFVFP